MDLEKIYDPVPREVMLRWAGMPKTEARMVEAMYERTTGRVVVGHGMF